MVEPLNEEEVDERIIFFLESDAECYEDDIPECKYSNMEEFNNHSSEKWAMGEILKRILNGEHAESAVWGFCGDMINYAALAKTEDSRIHFMAAYNYGYYLIENWDGIIFDED